MKEAQSARLPGGKKRGSALAVADPGLEKRGRGQVRHVPVDKGLVTAVTCPSGAHRSIVEAARDSHSRQDGTAGPPA